MKRLRIEVRPFCLRFRSPVVTARGVERERRGCLVGITDGEGLTGWGEATPLPAHGTETLEACGESLSATGARLRGFELRGTDALFRLSAEMGTAPAARHAVELACLDLLAQRAQEPLAQLLGAAPRQLVGVNALLTGATGEALAAEAAEARGGGFRTLKIKVGAQALDQDLARVAAVRDAVGGSVALRVDANGAWTAGQAIEALAAMSSLGVALCEQPVRSIEEMREVRRRARIPIAVDELLAEPGARDACLRREVADVAVLKPMVLGGLMETLRLAERARGAGLDCVVTSTLDGAIARAGAVHLACAIPDLALDCGLSTGHLLANDLAEPDPTRAEEGRVLCPAGPGLGIRPEGAR